MNIEGDIPEMIKQLMQSLLPRIIEITCENTYEGEGETRRLVGQRVTLYIKTEADDALSAGERAA